MFDSFVNSKAIELLDIEKALCLVNEYIKSVLNSTPKDIREITSHLSDAMGKGARAKLLLICAMDKNGHVPADAVNIAAGIEIFHLATLVHDDIIDDSHLRRGIQTIQSKFGKKQAVICGDYLLCIAIQIISETAVKFQNNKQLVSLLPEFITSAKNICIGEHTQSLHSGNVDITFKEYLKIISGKTAALFYLSAYSGAILCNDLPYETHQKQIQSLARFGRYLGIIFQIIDDCKDYEFSENDALKPVKHDISTGVITLPLILSISKNKAVRELIYDSFNDANSCNKLLAEVDKIGGVPDSKKIAEIYYNKALKFLHKGTVDSTEKRELLSAVLDHAFSSSKTF